MSAPDESERRANPPAEGQGVLANLPRTRPQRSSPRRVAARNAAAGNGAPRTTRPSASDPTTRRLAASDAPAAGPPRKPKSAAGTTRKRRAPSARRGRGNAAADVEPIPRQGFECERESASGPVAPPGGAEFLASAVELVGELAKGGVSAGERLLKDVFSHLPH